MEPTVVVAHREDLWWLLSEGAQLEHMIMCEYLFAEFSLKQGTDEGLAAEQAGIVDRWRETLHSIAVDEMLHLAPHQTAAGGDGSATESNPSAEGSWAVRTSARRRLPWTQALLHFLYLERPEGMERQDARGFVPTAPPREPLAAEETMPRGQEYATIGHDIDLRFVPRLRKTGTTFP